MTAVTGLSTQIHTLPASGAVLTVRTRRLCGSREAILRALLPHRKHIFEKVGATGTTLTSLTIKHLDHTHALAETTWTVDYEADSKPADVPILHTTFLLRLEDQWRVAVYLNHNDLLQLLGVV